jgi:hypothetical protein
MAQPARRRDAPDEVIPLDPSAVERAYHFHRAQRRRKVRRREESRLAHLRFYLVMLVLTAASIALLFGIWHEVRQLFGI